MYVDALGSNVITQSNFTNSTFSGNAANMTASGSGGAAYLNGGVTLFNDSSFEQNAASGFGGALAYSHSCFPPGTVILRFL